MRIVRLIDPDGKSWDFNHRSHRLEDLPKIRIVSKTGHGSSTEIYIDGQKLPFVKAVGFGVEADSPVFLRIEMYVRSVEYDGPANPEIVPIENDGSAATG